jgi:hypothetical protein
MSHRRSGALLILFASLLALSRAPAASASGEAPSSGELAVVLEEPVKDAVVTLDGKLLGPAPVRLSVAPGRHVVQIEAPEMRPYENKIYVWPGRPRTLEVKLKRVDSLYTGVFYVGWLYAPTFGRLFVGYQGDRYSYGLMEVPFGGSLLLGFAVKRGPIQIEIGNVYQPPGFWRAVDTSPDLMDPDVHDSFNFSAWGVLLRLLAPIKGPHVFLAGELELGISMLSSLDDDMEEIYFFILQFNTALRLGFAFFANDWWEFRINPLGFHLVVLPSDSYGVENGNGVILGYSPSIGIVLRL